MLNVQLCGNTLLHCLVDLVDLHINAIIQSDFDGAVVDRVFHQITSTRVITLAQPLLGFHRKKNPNKNVCFILQSHWIKEKGVKVAPLSSKGKTSLSNCNNLRNVMHSKAKIFS